MAHDYENGWTEKDQLAEDLREAEHYRYLYREALEKIVSHGATGNNDNGNPGRWYIGVVNIAREALEK